MGLSNKLATKVRTAAKTTPVTLPKPWDDRGTLAASAIVRAAVATLSTTGLTSSGVVGNDSFGMRSSKSAVPSTLWCDKLNSRTWQLSLGKPTVGGYVYDWQIQLSVTAAPGQELAEITTPAQLTRDGTLVNKAAHAELRDLLLTTLASGRAPTGRTEHNVSAASLPMGTLAPASQLAKDATTSTTIRTSLEPAELEQVLDLVPFHCTERSAGGRTWQLVEPGSGPTAEQPSAEARQIDGGLVIHTQLRPTGHDLADTLVAERAYALPHSVLQVLQLFDTDARIDNPTEQPS